MRAQSAEQWGNFKFFSKVKKMLHWENWRHSVFCWEQISQQRSERERDGRSHLLRDAEPTLTKKTRYVCLFSVFPSLSLSHPLPFFSLSFNRFPTDWLRLRNLDEERRTGGLRLFFRPSECVCLLVTTSAVCFSFQTIHPTFFFPLDEQAAAAAAAAAKEKVSIKSVVPQRVQYIYTH